MNEDVSIIPARRDLYRGMLNIYNESFLSKFRFVTVKNAQSCADDFGVLDPEIPEKHYIAVSGTKVLGLLILKFRGQKNNGFPDRLPFRELLGKYGWLGIFRILLLSVIDSHCPRKGELYIEAIGVAEEARGGGIGTLLLNYAFDFAEKHKLEMITLRVMHENNRAKALYERMGFCVRKFESFRWLKRRTGYSGAYFMVR